jgi:hypothetical protein
MNRSIKIFRLIKKDVSGVELCKDMLVVSPTEHILRGFLIEATAERGRVYLWRVVTPLHRPMKSVFLDYSDRIPQTGEDLYIDYNAYQESAAALREIVTENLEYLRSVRAPQDFLRHISRMMGNRSINFRFDLALTYYRVGDIRQCKDILRALDVEVDQMAPSFRLPVDQSIKQAAREIEADPLGFGRLLDRWEDKNVETLGLLASRLASGRPRLVG